MATKGEVRRGVEKYLRSKFSDYNNSVGQFDRVIMGVLSIMGSTLLQPDDPKFDHHIGLETERMLKKYGPGTDYYNERFGKKGKNKDSAMEYDPIACMMVPVKDQRTVDFSSSDAKKVFEYIDRHVTKDMNDYPREIERAKTSADCERLENSIRASLDDAVNEYIQIWNEVGLYAQKRKNEIVDRYGKLMSQAFKKYNELKARE